MLLAAAAPLPGLGPAGSANPRLRVDMRAPPWNAVVRVQSPGLSRCTGFLVAPDLVVTAAHCLHSARLGGPIPAASVHVLRQPPDGGHAVADRYVVAPGHDPARPDATRGADVAVLHLAAPLVGPGVALPLADAAAGPVSLGGFNQDRAEVIEADPSCHLQGLGRDAAGRALLAHDCAATRGSSGAPVLRHGEGGWQAVGVQVAARIDGLGGIAVPAASLRALLMPLL